MADHWRTLVDKRNISQSKADEFHQAALDAVVLELNAGRVSQDEAAKVFRVSVGTFGGWVRAHPDFVSPGAGDRMERRNARQTNNEQETNR